MSEIIVRVAVESDGDAILKFLRESYYPEEPLTLALEPFQQANEDEEFNMSCIKHGTCVIAYYDTGDDIFRDDAKISKDEDCKSQKLSEKDKSIHNEKVNREENVNKKCPNNKDLLGALIAGPKYPGEVEHLIDASNTVKSVKWSKMLKLLSFLELKSNVFKHFNCESAVHCHAMAVHQNARGKSIGIKMLNEFISACKNLNYPVITLDCTSIYSIKLCEKLNMICLNEMKFADYRDENGEQVFKPPSPHNVIKTFAKITNNNIK